jgi:hypothetical protein
MKKIISGGLIGMMLATAMPAHAASEAECAIWLCLPGGFPQGCSAAYSAFKRRIKKDLDPLPPFSSCAMGPSTGNYRMGYEQYMPCQEGYAQRNNFQSSTGTVRLACVVASCSQRQSFGASRCDFYVPELRPDPNYVEMWVDGDYLGKFYWR